MRAVRLKAWMDFLHCFADGEELVARVKANLNRNAVTLGWLRSPWREGLLIAVSKREIFEQCWLASAMPDRSMFPIDDPVTWRRISN